MIASLALASVVRLAVPIGPAFAEDPAQQSKAAGIGFRLESHADPFDYTGPKTGVIHLPLVEARRHWRLCAIVPHVKDEYWLSVGYGMVEEARRLGVALRISETGGYRSADQQASRIDACREEGADAIVGIHGPGQSFGEAAALLGTPAHATAETISETRILAIDVERLRSRLGADPDLAFAMLASASMHLRSMVDELERLKGLPGSRRVAGFLCDLAGSDEGAAAFALPYEKSLIAGRLGMTPESFSRALAKLRDRGVSIDRENVRIARIEALRDFFEGEAA